MLLYFPKKEKDRKKSRRKCSTKRGDERMLAHTGTPQRYYKFTSTPVQQSKYHDNTSYTDFGVVLVHIKVMFKL